MEIHIVAPGETIFSIAAKYGISPARLISDNGLRPSQDLVVGQALLILYPSRVYTVRQGDTVNSVAAAAGITPIELLQNNPYLVDAQGLTAGETLVISFAVPKRREVYITGYAYPFINRTVLLRALPFLTYLTIFSYGFTLDGELIGIDDSPLISLAYKFGVAPVMLLSSITENGNFSTEKASVLFNDIELQNKVLDNIVATMIEKGYVGLDIDFEFVAPEDREAFIGFVENAVAKLSPYGFFVNTDLAPKSSATQAGLLYEAHDYAALGAASDTLFLMTYEWGYTYGPPMAVAPINRVREVVEYAVSEIPNDKLILGIPNYGYDWPLPYVKGSTAARSIGNEEAIDIASGYGAEILFDERAKAPYFYYTDGGISHVVWFEDVRSILAKFNLMDEFALRGAGYWNIMRPFAQNYALLGAMYDIVKVV
ncbi:MAG: LysM peptidoglycan-binding domain-containing protein [Clostridia bacterium]|nr:LysM peptidoglycan-binding domain-containing protein [Clostridia bacterium]